MKNFLRILFGYCSLFYMIGFLILVITPISIIGIHIIMAVYYSISVGIVIWKKTRKQYSLAFPKIIAGFSALSLGTMTAITRTFLTVEPFDEQIASIRAIGEFICRDNDFYGFISVICIGSLYSYVIYGSSKYYCDEVFTKITKSYCRINGCLVERKISQSEADRLKQRITKFEDYCHLVNHALKLYSDIYKILTIVFVIDVAGGTLIGTFLRNQNWLEALCQYIVLFSGFFVYMCIPLSLGSLSFKIGEDKYCTCIL